MTAPRHLVSVWNPFYAADAMDLHAGCLLEWAERHRAGDADEDDVYVWWAKLRSENRQQHYPYEADVLRLDEQIKEGTETHLYLTDYRSLYVAHIGEVTSDSVLEDDPVHAPDYYRGRPVDFWFRLWDIRRLVTDDTGETVSALRRLRNVHYADRPVSLYGGMVNLPLVVTEDEPTSWFGSAELLTEGRLWADRDLELRAEVPRLARDLRDNLVGRVHWDLLEPAARTFLATAEATYRPRRDDPRFDFSGPAVEYAKAVETELNAVVLGALRKAFARGRPQERIIYLDGDRLDLGGPVRHQSLGALRHLLLHDQAGSALRSQLGPDGTWLTGMLSARLEVLADLRNAAAHRATTARDQISDAREEILGIGREGLLRRILQVKARLNR
jgi:hypothetical protein